MVNYIPLITTLISAIFAIVLLWQYSHRRKIHQLIWTAALGLYSLTALMEYLGNSDVLGPSPTLIRIYYAGTGPMVGLLGAGVLYLLTSKRWRKGYLAFVLILSVIVTLSTSVAQISSVDISEAFKMGLPQGFREVVTGFPATARIPTIILNITGSIILIGGALLSFIRDRSRTYNLALAVGGILPAFGGASIGFFNNAYIFFEFELAGTIFLFLGFILSIRHISKLEHLTKK